VWEVWCSAMSKCKACDGDGYQEKFNDDQSDVITWLCPKCNGSGEAIEEVEL